MFTLKDRLVVYGTIAAAVLLTMAMASYAVYLEYTHPEPYPVARTLSMNSGDTLALSCGGAMNIERRRDHSVFIKCSNGEP